MSIHQQIARGVSALAIAWLSANAYAVPELQLSIAGGNYDTTSQTSISNGPVFDLYGYLNRTSNAGTFFLSMALTPAVAESSPSPDFGFFTYNIGAGDVQVNVTSDMLFGVPPVDVGGVATSDPQDLQTHSVFPTYFKEIAISFAATDLSDLYDVQNVDDGAPVGSPTVPTASTMFFKKIGLNLNGLTGGKQLHFDLYDEVFRNQRCQPNDPPTCVDGALIDIDAGINAPFSHDAQSGASSSSGGGGASGEVPEPGSLSLIGAALLLSSLTLARRRRANRR